MVSLSSVEGSSKPQKLSLDKLWPYQPSGLLLGLTRARWGLVFSALHSPDLLAWHNRIMHFLSLSENFEGDNILPLSLSLSTRFQGVKARASFF